MQAQYFSFVIFSPVFIPTIWSTFPHITKKRKTLGVFEQGSRYINKRKNRMLLEFVKQGEMGNSYLQISPTSV